MFHKFMEKWEIPITQKLFFQQVKQKHIVLTNLKIDNDIISCCTSIFQHQLMKQTFPNAKSKPIGVWKIMKEYIIKISSIFIILSSICLWYVLSNVTFKIELDGEEALKHQMNQYIKKEIVLPKFQLDVKHLQKKLKSKFSNQLNWLEISKIGSKIKISYTCKKKSEIILYNRNQLFAQKDGVIAFFKLQHGEKMVHMNDFVKKGDLLVNNILINSNNTNEDIFVKGQVYAYTFEQVKVTMRDDKMPKPFQFYRLLFQARNEVTKKFHKEDRIEDENILHFKKEQGKITMLVLYTCYQDISTPYT